MSNHQRSWQDLPRHSTKPMTLPLPQPISQHKSYSDGNQSCSSGSADSVYSDDEFSVCGAEDNIICGTKNDEDTTSIMKLTRDMQTLRLRKHQRRHAVVDQLMSKTSPSPQITPRMKHMKFLRSMQQTIHHQQKSDSEQFRKITIIEVKSSGSI
ncbi:hypothetical protein SARC_07838 [Sphaeroforma arctica JP610]|uniref:Uncharacterized protein n=1 Tax=Sphaeroforma arctica JP610 TaxID=667725 RepID=A0A0L0FV17_9EUKA|nr:hypothetical protein SARC_07838 [Sphaeroforma arctica JP610]KNC79783.1 hypothetical protein SARC_07838 [Sphaeroforma arctica JP610]|eukprot:XP_014153685.1 hypothetical protein SARC_07838 [Sphaeroforma arctica JP610]